MSFLAGFLYLFFFVNLTQVGAVQDCGASKLTCFTFSGDGSRSETATLCSVFVLEMIAALLPTRNVAAGEAFVIPEPNMWNMFFSNK